MLDFFTITFIALSSFFVFCQLAFMIFGFVAYSDTSLVIINKDSEIRKYNYFPIDFLGGSAFSAAFTIISIIFISLALILYFYGNNKFPYILGMASMLGILNGIIIACFCSHYVDAVSYSKEFLEYYDKDASWSSYFKIESLENFKLYKTGIVIFSVFTILSSLSLIAIGLPVIVEFLIGFAVVGIFGLLVSFPLYVTATMNLEPGDSFNGDKMDYSDITGLEVLSWLNCVALIIFLILFHVSKHMDFFGSTGSAVACAMTLVFSGFFTIGVFYLLTRWKKGIDAINFAELPSYYNPKFLKDKRRDVTGFFVVNAILLTLLLLLWLGIYCYSHMDKCLFVVEHGKEIVDEAKKSIRHELKEKYIVTLTYQDGRKETYLEGVFGSRTLVNSK